MSPRTQPALPAEPNASEQPHDVLAAEEFAMPAPEAARVGGHVTLPADPSGVEEPHDVLAAEAFAMPAPPAHGGPVTPAAGAVGPAGRTRVAAVLAALGVGLLALRRRVRRRG